MLRALFVKDSRLRPVWRVFVFAVVLLLAMIALYAIWVVVTRRFSATLSLSDEIGLEILSSIVVLIVAVTLRTTLDRRSVASLGFAFAGPWARLFAIGIAFGAGMQTVAYIVETVSGSARVNGYGGVLPDVKLLVVAAIVFTAAALFEEMATRGYPFQNLWEQWGFAPALLITSLGFAALHGVNPHAREQVWFTLAGLTAFAVWACLSLLWTKSLWLALGAHMAWNLFEGPVFGFPVSGVMMPVPTVLSEHVGGPLWLTGGGFGPEAGASSLIGLAAGFIVLRFLYVRGAFANVADTREFYARR